MTDQIDDCIIVGAGPAGLTAAIYLARFHLAIRMFDCGTSRASWIPSGKPAWLWLVGIQLARLVPQSNMRMARWKRAR